MQKALVCKLLHKTADIRAPFAYQNFPEVLLCKWQSSRTQNCEGICIPKLCRPKIIIQFLEQILARSFWYAIFDMQNFGMQNLWSLVGWDGPCMKHRNHRARKAACLLTAPPSSEAGRHALPLAQSPGAAASALPRSSRTWSLPSALP